MSASFASSKYWLSEKSPVSSLKISTSHWPSGGKNHGYWCNGHSSIKLARMPPLNTLFYCNLCWISSMFSTSCHNNSTFFLKGVGGNYKYFIMSATNLHENSGWMLQFPKLKISSNRGETGRELSFFFF